MDYYSILGVNRNATPEEIRKAYKKQSMQHHPDRGGNEEKFKRINEAYSILKDPQKRQQYDNPQPQYHFNTNTGFEDIFGRRQQRRNPPFTIQADINLEDVYTGKELIANYRLPSGRVETVSITIPKGVRTGDTMRYPGMGNDIIPGAPRGDLHVKINVLNHKEFNVSGLDLTCTKKLNVFDLITGTSAEIHTPDGSRFSLKIPPKTQPDTTFNITGKGLPCDRTGRQGNIYVKVRAQIPKQIDEKLLAAINEYK
jgi:curved DNA-binding protein